MGVASLNSRLPRAAAWATSVVLASRPSCCCVVVKSWAHRTGACSLFIPRCSASHGQNPASQIGEIRLLVGYAWKMWVKDSCSTQPLVLAALWMYLLHLPSYLCRGTGFDFIFSRSHVVSTLHVGNGIQNLSAITLLPDGVAHTTHFWTLDHRISLNSHLLATSHQLGIYKPRFECLEMVRFLPLVESCCGALPLRTISASDTRVSLKSRTLIIP